MCGIRGSDPSLPSREAWGSYFWPQPWPKAFWVASGVGARLGRCSGGRVRGTGPYFSALRQRCSWGQDPSACWVAGVPQGPDLWPRHLQDGRLWAPLSPWTPGQVSKERICSLQPDDSVYQAPDLISMRFVSRLYVPMLPEHFFFFNL